MVLLLMYRYLNLRVSSDANLLLVGIDFNPALRSIERDDTIVSRFIPRKSATISAKNKDDHPQSIHYCE